MEPGPELEYAGFWIRVWACVIDSVLVMMVIGPLLWGAYGPEYWMSSEGPIFRGPLDVLLNLVFPAVAVVVFWIYRSATPGKMAIGARIVDANTGGKPSTSQLVGRYLGYYVSLIPFGLGLIWVAFDRRKQGWHDKLARTVVVRAKEGLRSGAGPFRSEDLKAPAQKGLRTPCPPTSSSAMRLKIATVCVPWSMH